MSLRRAPRPRSQMQRKPVILASLLLAAFAINLDTTIVNVALPTLVTELHASTTELEPQIQSTGFFRAKSRSLLGMATAVVCFEAARQLRR